MNYIELIRHFWAKDIQYQYSDTEIAFYFYILNVCNAQRWKAPFAIPNKIVYAKFGWGRQKLNNIQQRLKETNLIQYTKGLGRGNPYQYRLIDNNKQTNTMSENFTDEQLILPYQSSQFVDLWNQLVQMPKWKVKPIKILQANLDKLKHYDESFAIQLIEQSILGNWQGLIFRDTDTYYNKWKKEHNPNDEITNTSQDRKSEIVRRANLAIAKCNT